MPVGRRLKTMCGAQQQAFGEVWTDNLRRDREPVGETRRKCHRRVARDIEGQRVASPRSEEHTSELQSLMRISYAVFCLKKNKKNKHSDEYRTESKQTRPPLITVDNR